MTRHRVTHVLGLLIFGGFTEGAFPLARLKEKNEYQGEE